MNELSLDTYMDVETINDQLESIFHELDLALRWRRPSILFAIYNSTVLRRSAQDSLEKQILDSGQNVIHYQVEYESTLNLVQFVSEISGKENAVFYIDPLNSEGKSSQLQNLISLLNSCRDYLVDHLVRVVFWLTEKEALSVAHQAPDFWASRHRVFEFIQEREIEVQNSVEDAPSAWMTGQKLPMIVSSEANGEDMPGESALVLDLPAGEGPTISGINLLLMMGVENWKEGNHDKACEPLQAALAIAEKSGNNAHQVMCHKAIALVKTDSGKSDEAIQAYNQVIRLGLETVTIWNNIGSLYQKTGRYENALQAFNNALRLDPHDPVSWNGLGSVYANTARFEEAIGCYRKAIQFNASYMTPWVKLGDVLLRQHRDQDALYAYMRTVEMDNKNVHAWAEIGSIYFKAGSYEQAVDAYKKALILGIDSVELHSNLADAYTNSGSYTEAIIHYQKAIERENDNNDKAVLWNKLGDVRRRISDYESAVGAYEMADKLVTTLGEMESNSAPDAQPEPEYDPSQAVVNASLDAAAEVGQTDAVRSRFVEVEPAGQPAVVAKEAMPAAGLIAPVSNPESVQIIDMPQTAANLPSQSDLKNAQLWARLGSTYMKAGAIDRAIDVFQKVVNLDPSNVKEYSNLAQAYVQKNDLLEAVSVYRKSIDLLSSPSDKAITYSYIGDLYRQMREFVNALDAFEVALGLDPENETILAGLSKIQEDLDQIENPGLHSLTESTKTFAQTSPVVVLAHVESTSDPKMVGKSDQTVEINNINLNNANVWNELGNIFTRAKVYAEAVDAYNKAIELNPHFGWSYSNLALVYARQGKREDAVSLYRRSIELLWTDLDKAVAWNRLGDVYRQSGNYAEAISAYQNADRLNQGGYEIGASHEISSEQLFTHFVS